MAEIIVPPRLKFASNKFRYIDSTGMTRGVYTGAAETTAYGGDRIGSTLVSIPQGGKTQDGIDQRATLLAWLVSLKGKQSRVLMPDHAYQKRGSFAAPELFANSLFVNGSTGWSADSDYALTASDRVLRSTRAAFTGTALAAYQSITPVRFAPYALRVFRRTGRGSFSGQVLKDASEGSSSAISDGLSTFAYVIGASGARNVGLSDPVSNGENPGDFIEIPFASLARCALVDNSLNSLIHSDDFTTTWVNSATTDSADTAVAPDGTVSADSLIEDSTASSTHYIRQTATKVASLQDWCGCVFAKQSTRSQVALQIGEQSGNFARFVVDLTNGSISSAATSVGTVANPRAFVADAGNGWWFVSIVASIPSTITTTNGLLVMLAVSGNPSYSGDGASKIFVWRGAYAQSSVPFIPAQTTTTASTGTSQAGSSLNLKGLPVSSSGLLLPGDWVQIGKQITMVTAALNSDAAGRGYLQFSPPLRTAPADNDPVIVNQPMGRFLYAGTSFAEWSNDPGVWTNVSLDFEESCDA